MLDDHNSCQLRETSSALGYFILERHRRCKRTHFSIRHPKRMHTVRLIVWMHELIHVGVTHVLLKHLSCKASSSACLLVWATLTFNADADGYMLI